MTDDKEFRSLSKAQLIDIVLKQESLINALKRDKNSLENELNDRNIKINKAGSIADASVVLSGLFDTVQETADLYLESVINNESERLNKLKQMEDEAVQKTNTIYEDADRVLYNAFSPFIDLVTESHSLFNEYSARLNLAERDYNKILDDMGFSHMKREFAKRNLNDLKALNIPENIGIRIGTDYSKYNESFYDEYTEDNQTDREADEEFEFDADKNEELYSSQELFMEEIRRGRTKSLNVKKIIFIIVILIALLAGAYVFAYPLAKDIISERKQAQIMANYENTVEKISADNIKTYLEEAKKYNEALVNKNTRFMFFTDKQKEEYESLLNFDEKGIMATLFIEKTGANLPVYHSISGIVPEGGLGHFEGSSLPVGGESTHCVITGEESLYSEKPWTDLESLTEGDRFSIKILNEELFNEVDRILTVLPNEMGALEISEDMDYCTLMAGVPYGINSHRLLVRGRRGYE